MDWQPIPENGFLENLAPGHYLLHNQFVPDTSEHLLLEDTDIQLEADACLRGSVEKENLCIEKLQHGILSETIMTKIQIYNSRIAKLKAGNTTGSVNNQYEKCNLRIKLQNIGECLLKGFDYFVPLHVGDQVRRGFGENLSRDFANTSPCSSNPSMPHEEDTGSLIPEKFDAKIIEGGICDTDKTIIDTDYTEFMMEKDTFVIQKSSESEPIKDMIVGPNGCNQSAFVSKIQDDLEESYAPSPVPTLVCSSSLSNVAENYGQNDRPKKPYTAIALKTLSVSVCRLESQLPPEKMVELWEKYFRGINMKKPVSIKGKQEYSETQQHESFRSKKGQKRAKRQH